MLPRLFGLSHDRVLPQDITLNNLVPTNIVHMLQWLLAVLLPNEHVHHPLTDLCEPVPGWKTREKAVIVA